MDRHTVRIDPSTPDPHADLGGRGESLARAHLRDDGLEVLASNWRLTAGRLRGELDVVAVDRATGELVVCEVKTRRGDAFGGPLVAVDARKQARIRRLTAAFLAGAELGHRRVRFDVVGLWLPPGGPGRLTHLPGAF